MTFFKAEDFENYIKALGIHNPVSAKIVADIAESKLQREGMVVYICEESRKLTKIHFAQPVDATHKGLLICIEELPKKECEHKPSMILTGNKLYICSSCHKEIRPTGWEVVE